MALDEARHRQHEQQLWALHGGAPTEQLLTLSRTGATLRVQEVGEGPPVVFVHGASNTGSSWAPLVPHLSGLRCILVDRPGCGLSPRRDGRFDDVAALARFADDFVVDVLDALGLDGADVVATSFGGYLALRAAAAHPDRVRRLVELGWTIGAPMGHLPLVMRLASAPWLGRLGTRLPVSDRMVRSLLRQIGLRDAIATGRMTDVEVAWFGSVLRHTDTMRNELDAGPRIMSLRGWNADVALPADLLGSITTATLFVWGADDPFGNADVARGFAPLVPGSTLEIVPGGHAVWMDDAAGVGAIVRSFLVG